MRKMSPQLSGILIGLSVALLCIAYFFVIESWIQWESPFKKLELLSFDLRVRNCNTLECNDSIVHLDIDDSSLERVGRWPWHRHELAAIIRTLDELGAETIAVDLLLDEREWVVVDHPKYSRDADVEPNVPVIGELSDENVIFSDLELKDAIQSAGKVFLAIQLDPRSPAEPDTNQVILRQLWEDRKSLGVGEALEALGLEDTGEKRAEIGRALLRLRMTERLREDFTKTDQALAAELGVSLGEVVGVVAGVKRRTARELVGRLVSGGGLPTFDEVSEAVLHRAKDTNNPDRADVKRAYRYHLGLAAARESTHHLDPAITGNFSRSKNATPPYYHLGQAAWDIGAVNFKQDFDGSTRRVPLLVSYEGRAVKQLGFAVACHLLNLDADNVTVSAAHVMTVPRRRGKTAYSIPLDGEGNLIINWTKTAKHWRDFEDFPHISAAKIWAIVDAREQMCDNSVRMAYAYAEVVALSKGEIQVSGGEGGQGVTTSAKADRVFRMKVNDHLDLGRRIHLAELQGSPQKEELDDLREQRDALWSYIELEQGKAVSRIELDCEEIEKIPPEQLESDPEARALLQARELIRGRIAQLQSANRNLEKTVESLKRELVTKIQGKHVFLGYAATASGDIVTTPIDPSTHGVICHAQVLNSFLEGRFISRAAPWAEILICLSLSALVCVITARRGPAFALVSTLGLVVAYALLNAYVIFMWAQVWLALATPIMTCLITWAVVTLYRQLTAERERRFFAKQLSQYTSPAIAARIAESPEAAEAFKTVQSREMTCFFSDLQGFTTITEEEDAEVVQYVLNTYLDRMSEAIWSQRGLINKFMGDGIMAFFNPSVDPLPDHPRIAAETTLLTLDALDKLKAEQKDHPASPIFNRLFMRVGIATGICKNGDLGSDLKADYTVIGDVVNLAARLEPANKVFGTRIMISGPTHEIVKDQYEFRYLAELQVKGKSQTVPAYELVCRKGELTDEQREYIERFEAGVALYKQQKWDPCLVHFTRLLARKFDDVGASRYIDACQEFKAFPPEDDWNGALELKEK